MGEKETSVKEITRKYIDAAIKQREAIRDGNPKVANKQYAQLRKLYMKFVEQEALIDEVLTPLLGNEDFRVRSWAAAHSLGLKRNIECAEKVLEKISHMEEIGILSFSAEMTLKVWKKQGYLKF